MRYTDEPDEPLGEMSVLPDFLKLPLPPGEGWGEGHCLQ